MARFGKTLMWSKVAWSMPMDSGLKVAVRTLSVRVRLVTVLARSTPEEARWSIKSWNSARACLTVIFFNVSPKVIVSR